MNEILHIDANEKMEVLYPFRLIDRINQYPKRSVIVSSVKANELFMPSIFFICPEADMDYFHIKIPPPEPNIKFRYLPLEGLAIIEIILRFGKKRDLTFHLNPSNKLVKHFLLSCIKVSAISFHFHCLERKMMVSSFTDLDDEELDWLKRNYDRSRELKFSAELFSMSSEQLSREFKRSVRFYRFNEITTDKILAEQSSKFMQYGTLDYH